MGRARCDKMHIPRTTTACLCLMGQLVHAVMLYLL